MRDLGLDVFVDDGVDGRIESIGPGRVVVVGDWSDGAGLILRPDSRVVVLTRDWHDTLVRAPAYVYRRTGEKVWTVGFFTPSSEWEPESEYASKKGAARRVCQLNGGD